MWLEWSVRWGRSRRRGSTDCVGPQGPLEGVGLEPLLWINEEQALNRVMCSDVCVLCSLCGEEMECGSREARPRKCSLLLYVSFLSLQSKETVLKTMLQGHRKDCQARGAWSLGWSGGFSADRSCLDRSEIEHGMEPRGTETELGSPREPPCRPALVPLLSEAPPVLTALTASGDARDSASLRVEWVMYFCSAF